MKWFAEVFIPQAHARATKFGDVNDLILLTFDSHGSHLTDKLHEEAIKNNIHFHKFHAHTTHKVQPCDVGCFGPMSKKWLERMEDIVKEMGERLQKHDFVKEYMAVWEASIDKESVLAAFRKTGIEPFNPDIFTPEDFTPSHVSSTMAHMPPSFPSAASSSVSTSDILMESPPPSPLLTATNDKSPALSCSPPLSTDTCCEEDSPSTIASGSNAELAPASNCAVGLDGHLLNASQISWDYDPDDQDIPMLPPLSPSTPIPPPPAKAIPIHSWGPKVPKFAPSIIDRHAPLAQQLKTTQKDLNDIHQLYLKEFQQRQVLKMHADLAGQEIEKLKT